MQNEELGFSKIGSLRSESVDHSAVFSAVKSSAQGFKQASEQQKKIDAGQRQQGYVVEDALGDVQTLEASLNSGSVADFAAVDPDRPEETDQVRQLRQQGGRASAVAELTSRRAHLQRLQSAPPEDIAFIQQQYLQRGNTASAKQFLQAEQASIAAAEKSTSEERTAAILSETGIDLPITDYAQFNAEWESDDPNGKYADIKKVMSETSITKLKKLNAENNPEAVAFRVGEYINSTGTGMAQQLIGLAGTVDAETLEARGQEAIGQFRTQLEARIGFLPSSMQATYRAQAQKEIDFIERLATGKAKSDEISLKSKRVALNNARLTSAKISAETALTEQQLAAQVLQQARTNFKHAEEFSQIIQKAQDKVILAADSAGYVNPDNLSTFEQWVHNNPQGVQNAQTDLFNSLSTLTRVGQADASPINIGEAGNINLTGFDDKPVEDVLTTAGTVIAGMLDNQQVFSGPDAERGLKMWMDYSANRVNLLAGPERSQAYAMLRPLMDTPEFAQLAKDYPRAIGPWTNLLVAEQYQKNANLMNSLALDLHNDAEFQGSLVRADAANAESIASGSANIANVQSNPRYFTQIVAGALPTLAAKIDQAGGDSSALAEFASKVQGPDQVAYLNGLGEEGYKQVEKSLTKAVESAEGVDGKKELTQILKATKDYYKGREASVRASVSGATSPALLYRSMADVVVIDQEHFEATGEYRQKLDPAFLGAYKNHPDTIRAAETRLSLHNNSAEMNGFRGGLRVLKNATGVATVQEAYQGYTVSRPAKATRSLTPTLQEALPQDPEEFLP